METFHFDHEPTFAELWDMCVYQFLYEPKAYTDDIEQLFKRLGTQKQSKIIDVSAGGGFPAIELVKDGYDITCIDGFEDEVALFNAKAQGQGLAVKCTKLLWKELPKSSNLNNFDFLFCRGNSFIYAGGGWNSMVDIRASEAIKNYKETLKVFYDLLVPGGWIYIDKFQDTETTHKEKVTEISVKDGTPEDLIFWTERFPEQKVRRASMIRKQGSVEKAVPNITYDLSSMELESFLTEVGFKNIQKISLPSEKHFDVWIAQK